MKKVFVLAIVIILILLLVMLVLTVTFSESNIDEMRDKDTGRFLCYSEQLVFVEYRDGTVEPVTTNPLLALFYNNRPVTDISYSLRMKKTDENIPVRVDMSGFVHRIDVHDADNTKINTMEITFDNVSEVFISTEFADIVSWERFSLDFIWYHFTEGTYRISFIPEGEIKYDIGDGWVDSTLPKPLYINMDLKDDRVVNIVFR